MSSWGSQLRGERRTATSGIYPMIKRQMRRGFLPSLLLCSSLGACSDGTAPQISDLVRVDPAWVVGDAAAALDSVSGQFRLTPPQIVVVSMAHAETLAVAIARSYGDPNSFGNARAVLEQDRGAPIEFDKLHVCSRRTYVSSAVGPLPTSVPGWIRRTWGPHWALPMCGDDGSAQLSVGIADNPLDSHVENGRLVLRADGGGADFTGIGVPVRYRSGLPVSPEEAVAIVVRLTGRRVSSVPVAFNQRDASGIGQFPLCASWRVFLEGQITVHIQSTGQTREVQELFIHNAPTCFSDNLVFDAASATQPTSQWIAVPHDSLQGFSSGVDSVLAILVGPTVFERVTVGR
jgi:hypothetical protein